MTGAVKEPTTEWVNKANEGQGLGVKKIEGRFRVIYFLGPPLGWLVRKAWGIVRASP